MTSVALIHALGFTSLDTQYYKDYVQKVVDKVHQINPDILLFVEKYRVDSGDLQEVYELSKHLKVICTHKTCVVFEPGITTLESIREVKEYLEKNISEPIDQIHTIAPNIFIYQKLFLTTKHLAPLVGFDKSEHDLYEAVVDILRSSTMEELINSRDYKLGKFHFHSIEGDRPLREVYRQIISGMREMVGDRYPDIDENYTEWRRDQMSSSS